MSARPRTLALVDAIVTVLREDGPGTPDEIAQRIGTIACQCAAAGRPGVDPHGVTCWCIRSGRVGWRPCARHDVYRLLIGLKDAGAVVRTDGRGTHAPATWSTVIVHEPTELEAMFDLPATKEGKR